MPNKLRDLSGKEVVKFLETKGFEVYKTRGSHCKMKRIISADNYQTLFIPLHKSITKATLHDIYHQILNYLPEPEIRNFFFTE